MNRLSAWFGVAVLGLAFAVSVVPLHAHTFSASAVEAEATIADGLANVSFKIEITNHAPSPMTNVVVVFADNTEVTIGDVAGEAKATSETQSRTIDVSDSSTGSVTIKVTLKYAVDGENVEAPCILSVLAQ